jgi:hypothetical protein
MAIRKTAKNISIKVQNEYNLTVGGKLRMKYLFMPLRKI